MRSINQVEKDLPHVLYSFNCPLYYIVYCPMINKEINVASQSQGHFFTSFISNSTILQQDKYELVVAAVHFTNQSTDLIGRVRNGIIIIGNTFNMREQ